MLKRKAEIERLQNTNSFEVSANVKGPKGAAALITGLGKRCLNACKVNKKADPAKVGKFISDTSFTPTVIKKNGSYYFIARKKESDGKLGKAITTEYKYKR